MERLTVWREDGRASIENKGNRMTPMQQAMRIPDVIDRLASIEDILGDTYELDELRELNMRAEYAETGWERAIDSRNGWEGRCQEATYRAEDAEKRAQEAKELVLELLGETCDLDRLRELVEADRDGRCVVLPCKVGDKIYEIIRHRNSGKVEIQEYFVNAVETSEDGVTVKSHRWRPTSTGFLSQKVPNWVKGSDFGKTVFLTREAAEKALKERDHGDVYL